MHGPCIFWVFPNARVAPKSVRDLVKQPFRRLYRTPFHPFQFPFHCIIAALPDPSQITEFVSCRGALRRSAYVKLANMSRHFLSTRTLLPTNLIPILSRLSICRSSQQLSWTAFQPRIPAYHMSTQSNKSSINSAQRSNIQNISSPKTSHASMQAANRAIAPSTPKPGYQPYTPVRPPPRPKTKSKPQGPQWPPRPEPGGRQGLSPALAGWLMGVVFMGGAYGLAWWYDVKLLTDRWWMSAIIMVFLLFLVF
jgi:hypothetical protein